MYSCDGDGHGKISDCRGFLYQSAPDISVVSLPSLVIAGGVLGSLVVSMTFHVTNGTPSKTTGGGNFTESRDMSRPRLLPVIATSRERVKVRR